MRDTKPCHVTLSLHKNEPLHSPVELEITSYIERKLVHSRKIDLVWENLHLIGLFNMGLLLSNIERFKHKKMHLIDVTGYKKKYRVPLYAYEAAYGLGVFVSCDVKMAYKKKMRTESDVWFLDWEFADPSSDGENAGLSTYKSLPMIVDPEKCEEFGKKLQVFTLKLHTELFARWSAETDKA